MCAARTCFKLPTAHITVSVRVCSKYISHSLSQCYSNVPHSLGIDSHFPPTKFPFHLLCRCTGRLSLQHPHKSTHNLCIFHVMLCINLLLLILSSSKVKATTVFFLFGSAFVFFCSSLFQLLHSKNSVHKDVNVCVCVYFSTCCVYFTLLTFYTISHRADSSSSHIRSFFVLLPLLLLVDCSSRFDMHGTSTELCRRLAKR